MIGGGRCCEAGCEEDTVYQMQSPPAVDVGGGGGGRGKGQWGAEGHAKRRKGDPVCLDHVPEGEGGQDLRRLDCFYSMKLSTPLPQGSCLHSEPFFLPLLKTELLVYGPRPGNGLRTP